MRINKSVAALAYLFFFPSIYIILSGYRKRHFESYHGTQAFCYWLMVIGLMVVVRWVGYNYNLVNLIRISFWLILVFWFPCWIFAYNTLKGKEFSLPLIGFISRVLSKI